MRGRRAFRILIMVLVVTSVVAPATAGQAAAIGEEINCNLIDNLFYVVSLFELNQEECAPSYLTEDIKQLQAADQDEAKAQIHDKANSVYGGSQDFLDVVDNYAKDSQATAISKGEAAAIDVIDSGGSLAEAKQAANESVEDYYTKHQMNVIDRYNDIVYQIYLLENYSRQEGVGKNFVDYFAEDGSQALINDGNPGSRYAV